MNQAITNIIVKLIAWTLVVVWYIERKYRYVADGHCAYDVRKRRASRRALKEISDATKSEPPGKRPKPPPMPDVKLVKLEDGSLSAEYVTEINSSIVFARELEIIDSSSLFVDCQSMPDKVVYPDGLAIYRSQVSSKEWNRHLRATAKNREPGRPPAPIERPQLTTKWMKY